MRHRVSGIRARRSGRGGRAPAAPARAELEEDVMRKLRLELDELSVQSFETQRRAGGVGTVHGRGMDFQVEAITAPPPATDTCPQVTYCASCVATCETCYDPTCNSCNLTRCYTGNAPQCCA